jgi:hypothetical protein
MEETGGIANFFATLGLAAHFHPAFNLRQHEGVETTR